ncbi:unnamed protein product [Toxocara canis]|uniref:G_PROTEIN_RECEP_F1_2 domain-containing protein n=1 Tax=Toxocara canis TaxID=6265 RepID=A0A183UMT7_TOXCA|nr:unnamed protein product [Toxocara canis]
MSGPMGASNFTTMFVVPVMGNVTMHIRAHRRNPVLTVSVVLCDLFGAICFLLNVFIIVTLIRNRRRVLTNVFYVIVLHCAVVDLIRGCCLIAWGMPHLLMNSMPTMQDRLLALKVTIAVHSYKITSSINSHTNSDTLYSYIAFSHESVAPINQITLVILRSCNLLTIFNLLVFTTNEFIVIRYPLHYRRYFRRKAVLLILFVRCNSHRRWRMHLMSRHKYLIVIGSVLFVDILFLFPYSGIQMVAFLHLNNLLTTSHRSTLIRWGLQILIGVHSVCQPLCYFRMTEFRRLACCCKTLQRNRSRSFTQMPKSGGSFIH